MPPIRTSSDLSRSLAAAVFAVVLAGCTDRAAPDAAVPPDATPDATPSFDPSVLAPGDTVLGLRVEAVDVHPGGVDPAGWTGVVTFAGPVTLTGEVRPHPGYPEVADLCFFPEAASAARLPRFANDERTSWLCFTNGEEARQRLPVLPADGPATVVVDDFAYTYAPTDTYNTARLVRVVSQP